MWEFRYLKSLDLKPLVFILGLMIMSLLVISSATDVVDDPQFFTHYVNKQLKWFGIGWVVYFFFAGFDYKKFKNWSGGIYLLTLILLAGLFLTKPIQNVQRWYWLPGLGMELQPSEYAKLGLVIGLSSFLEVKRKAMQRFIEVFKAFLIVLIPFFLILKQPDLGTALILCPITLVLFYFGGVKRVFIRWMSYLALSGFVFVSLIFLNIISHESLKPYVTIFLKDYQYERLNPHTYHQKISQAAIAMGGLKGAGWHKGESTLYEWLPAAHTDSVFAAFAEEFGVIGVFLMLLFFLGLLYFSIQVSIVAKDLFGKLLAGGITTYLAMHVIVNMGMMCGFLPITGVPLILITYGGSSVLSTMMSLGILQSIYIRRFMF